MVQWLRLWLSMRGPGVQSHFGEQRSRVPHGVPKKKRERERRGLEETLKRKNDRMRFFKKLIYLFLAALGLCCCARAFPSCGEWGLLLVAACGLLIAVVSLVAEHGL